MNGQKSKVSNNLKSHSKTKKASSSNVSTPELPKNVAKSTAALSDSDNEALKSHKTKKSTSTTMAKAKRANRQADSSSANGSNRTKTPKSRFRFEPSKASLTKIIDSASEAPSVNGTLISQSKFRRALLKDGQVLSETRYESKLHTLAMINQQRKSQETRTR